MTIPPNASALEKLEKRTQRHAMRWSLAIGVAMLVLKGAAYWVTGSTAILSDAAESAVHVAVVAFAAYSLWLAQQPPDRNHLYGHERIAYFSAGFEGALIALAGLAIIVEAITRLYRGATIANLDYGMVLTSAAAGINGVLGWFLIRVGKRTTSSILVANGRHVLSDSLTSLGVLVGLGLVKVTGRWECDPAVASLVALHIFWAGWGLVSGAVRGLMDETDPQVDAEVRRVLSDWTARTGGAFHGLRHRTSGRSVWIEVHILFPGSAGLEAAHDQATELERQIQQALAQHEAAITTHLEPMELHETHHPEGGEIHRDVP